MGTYRVEHLSRAGWNTIPDGGGYFYLSNAEITARDRWDRLRQRTRVVEEPGGTVLAEFPARGPARGKGDMPIDAERSAREMEAEVQDVRETWRPSSGNEPGLALLVGFTSLIAAVGFAVAWFCRADRPVVLVALAVFHAILGGFWTGWRIGWKSLESELESLTRCPGDPPCVESGIIEGQP